MAKKKNKKDKSGSGSPDPVEAVRAAIERTFHATTEGAAGTQKRTRHLVDEVTHAAARIRETIEDLRVLDEVKGLRNDIEALARRVAALETSSAAKPAARTAAKPAARTTAASRSRTTTRAKAAGTSRAKTTGAKSSSAKPAAARKPRTTGSSSTSGSRSPGASGGTSS